MSKIIGSENAVDEIKITLLALILAQYYIYTLSNRDLGKISNNNFITLIIRD